MQIDLINARKHKRRDRDTQNTIRELRDIQLNTKRDKSEWMNLIMIISF